MVRKEPAPGTTLKEKRAAKMNQNKQEIGQLTVEQQQWLAKKFGDDQMIKVILRIRKMNEAEKLDPSHREKSYNDSDEYIKDGVITIGKGPEA